MKAMFGFQHWTLYSTTLSKYEVNLEISCNPVMMRLVHIITLLHKPISSMHTIIPFWSIHPQHRQLIFRQLQGGDKVKNERVIYEHYYRKSSATFCTHNYVRFHFLSVITRIPLKVKDNNYIKLLSR